MIQFESANSVPDPHVTTQKVYVIIISVLLFIHV